LSLIGEVFNLYNKANLTGYSGDLTSAAFGQPTSRATQVFGSGGRARFNWQCESVFDFPHTGFVKWSQSRPGGFRLASCGMLGNENPMESGTFDNLG